MQNMKFNIEENIKFELIAKRATDHKWTIPPDSQGREYITVESYPIWIATYWPSMGMIEVTINPSIVPGKDEQSLVEHIIEILEGKGS